MHGCQAMADEAACAGVRISGVPFGSRRRAAYASSTFTHTASMLHRLPEADVPEQLSHRSLQIDHLL